MPSTLISKWHILIACDWLIGQLKDSTKVPVIRILNSCYEKQLLDNFLQTMKENKHENMWEESRKELSVFLWEKVSLFFHLPNWLYNQTVYICDPSYLEN